MDHSIDIYCDLIEDWHRDRNLIDGSTDAAQFVKLTEELGELAGNIARGKCIKDDLGDMFVVMVNIAARNNVDMGECIETAYNDIKDRKGKMVDGVFIKEEPDTAIPVNATHVNEVGNYLKQINNYWSIYIDGGWRIISGDPQGTIKSILQGA